MLSEGEKLKDALLSFFQFIQKCLVQIYNIRSQNRNVKKRKEVQYTC